MFFAKSKCLFSGNISVEIFCDNEYRNILNDPLIHRCYSLAYYIY